MLVVVGGSIERNSIVCVLLLREFLRLSYFELVLFENRDIFPDATGVQWDQADWKQAIRSFRKQKKACLNNNKQWLNNVYNSLTVHGAPRSFINKRKHSVYKNAYVRTHTHRKSETLAQYLYRVYTRNMRAESKV